jgi:hypothetical protein
MSAEFKQVRIVVALGVITILCSAANEVIGQGRITQPVYRVANETSAAEDVKAAAAQVELPQASNLPPQTIAATPGAFDLTQQPGEHVLAPVIRACKASLEHLDKNVPDYSCTLIKQERLRGELGEPQYIMMKVRHDPFSVYMMFLKPHKDREVLYVHGQNEGELIVQEAGFLGGLAGKLSLHPESTTAMNGQKYPITRVGIRNLLGELIRNFEADTKYLESDVKLDPKFEYNKRVCTMIQVTHPVPRQNFRSHIARIFFDNELRVPILYDAYMWPEKDGQAPPLEESYQYTNLKFNNGFTARDFDAEGGLIFK